MICRDIDVFPTKVRLLAIQEEEFSTLESTQYILIMRSAFVSMLLILLAANLKAQEFYDNFREIEEVNCPFQSGTTVEWPVGWSVYHTKNNLWDGEVDSAWCISLDYIMQVGPDYMYISAEEIDGERPVFIRTLNHPDLPVLMPPNMLFVVGGLILLEDGTILHLGTGNPPASGILISIDIPAEDGVQRDRRNNFYEFGDSTIGSYSESCFASEKFADQYLQEVVLALSLRYTIDKGYLAELGAINVYPVYYFDILAQHDIDKQWWVDTSYVIPVSELGSMPYPIENYLLPYTSPEYPSSQHISYYELSPFTLSDTAVTISVLVEEYMSLVPQPFTAFRGGLVEGSDSLRHCVELINNGGSLCLEIVEIAFEDDTKYVHKAGTVEMTTDAACMMFKAGAAMEIGDKAHLDYGSPAKGFLAMKQGSQLILNDDASMTINNTLVLQLTPTTDRTHPTVYLHPGSKLSFSETAHLEAWGSADLRLQVMMLGGTLDVDALDVNERALIEIIYPSTIDHSDHDKLIVIQDQPGQIRVLFNGEQAEQGTIYIVDLMGRVLIEESCDIAPGRYYITVNTGMLLPGWYGVIVETEGRRMATSFVR